MESKKPHIPKYNSPEYKSAELLDSIAETEPARQKTIEELGALVAEKVSAANELYEDNQPAANERVFFSEDTEGNHNGLIRLSRSEHPTDPAGTRIITYEWDPDGADELWHMHTYHINKTPENYFIIDGSESLFDPEEDQSKREGEQPDKVEYAVGASVVRGESAAKMGEQIQADIQERQLDMRLVTNKKARQLLNTIKKAEPAD